MASNTLISQELFDETVIENEECFDLSPDEALSETIDQFCQQLGVVSTNYTNDITTSSGSEPSPRSVVGDNNNTEISAAVVPKELSHLILSHPNSSDGKQERENRSTFQDNLTKLDSFVNTDGTVTIPTHYNPEAPNCENSLRALLGVTDITQPMNKVALQCAYGDSPHKQGSPLSYLAIFQRTSSIYTLMSFLSVIDPMKQPLFQLTKEEDDNRLKILTTTLRTLSSVLSSKTKYDNVQCAALRDELRDLFIPALGRLVNLIGGIAKSILEYYTEDFTHPDDDHPEGGFDIREELSDALCCLLSLGVDTTRGCEGGKVAFVQSTLPVELKPNTNNKSNGTSTKRGGVAVIISCLSMTEEDNEPDNTRVLTEACLLLASLCRYDDFRDPSTSGGGGGAMAATGVSTSSAHDHAMEFHRAGASSLLVKIARDVLLKMEESCSTEEEEEDDSKDTDNERLAAAVLTALRVLAINDDIIQNMVALGVLPIVTKALELGVLASNTTQEAKDVAPKRLVAASLGLLRNLCGNDEIKTNLCLGSTDQNSKSATPSILPHLLQAMKAFVSTAVIQEHACGTLAAMALRRPANARAILDAEGPRLVLLAMKKHDMNVNVQRQGALAIRNIVSRLLRDLPDEDVSTESKTEAAIGDERSSIRDSFLELGAEDVLRNITGRHQGSVDEAYAALRDLGCKVSLVKFNSDDMQQPTNSSAPLMFGGKHNSNFRPVYEESKGLEEGVDSAVSQFGA